MPIPGPALAVAGAAQWTSNFAITVTFPMLLAGIGLAGAYGIYMVVAILSIFFVVRYVRETKGKELEQMEGLRHLASVAFRWRLIVPSLRGQAALSRTRKSPSMVLDGAIHGANGPGEGGLPPPDSFMVRADAAKRWSVVAGVRGKPSRAGGVTQGGTVGAMGWAHAPDGLGRSPTPVLPCAQDSAREQGAIEPPWMGSRRVLPWVTPPAQADCREAPMRPTRPQSLQSRKTEKPAQGRAFSVPAAATGAP